MTNLAVKIPNAHILLIFKTVEILFADSTNFTKVTHETENFPNEQDKRLGREE